uniref:Uncharacterized protein n=1 Tax=Acrobeloides nanus TaxID=290746 RepID=A0A914CH26_9BILA
MWLLNRIQQDLSSWAHNFFQTPLWIKHTPEDLADVRNPRLEYSIYWIIKSAEVSSVISGLIVHPIYRYYMIQKLTPETTTNNSHKKIRNACRRMQGRCLIGAICIAPLLSVIYSEYIRKWTENELRNHCYYIRKDFKNLSVDRFSMAFGVVGWYWKRFQGAVDGINLGIAAGIFNVNIMSKFNPIPDLQGRLELTKEPLYENIEDAIAHKDRFTKAWVENHGELPTNRKISLKLDDMTSIEK